MNNKLFSFNFRKMMRCTGILMAALVMTLVACRSNETHRTRLTQTEMDTYGKAIAGQYEGSYVILWANSSMCRKKWLRTIRRSPSPSSRRAAYIFRRSS